VILTRDTLPRRRFAGPVVLDLLLRDALVGEARVKLHPREFELLWRLSDCPGEAVGRTALLREVWGLEDRAGSKTVEVHICRLRTKLGRFGTAWIVATHPDGGYFLDAEAGTSLTSFRGSDGDELDSYVRIGDDVVSRQEVEGAHGVSRKRSRRDRVE